MDYEPPAPRSAPTGGKFRLDWVVAPVFFTVIAILILKDHVPAIDDAIERVIHPTTFTARKACHAAALAGAGQAAFARITAPGEVHETQAGAYVDGVIVGEMGPSGGEVTFAFSCYVDRDGKVVKSQKGASTPPDASPQALPRKTLSDRLE